MNRFQTASRILGAILCLSLAAAVGRAFDDEKEKEKPKNAATFDDRTATLTHTVDGKEKTTKLDLKYALKAKGYFDDKGFHIEEIDADGPAAKLSTGEDAPPNQMEKGDIVTEIEGKPATSAESYVKAMNGAADHAKTKLKVKDVRTGNVVAFVTNAEKR